MMIDGHYDNGFSMIELLVVLLILALVAWVASGQLGRSPDEGEGSNGAERLFADARLAAARSGTPQVVIYDGGSGTASSEDMQAQIVVFPDGTFARRTGMVGEVGHTHAPGVPRGAFHAFEVGSW